MAARDGLRKCRTCEKRLPYEAFSRGRAKRDRLSTICKKCHAAKQRERERWMRNGRVCPRCEQTRACPDEISMAQAPVCKLCQRKRHSIKEAARRRKPEVRAYYRENMRTWRRENREAAQEAQRRYREKVYSDPERAQEWRDYQRIYHRLWRERQGIKVRTSSLEQYRKLVKPDWGHKLPAAPLAQALERLIAGCEDREIACEALGTCSRSLAAWNSGERQEVQFNVADTILCRTDLLWWDVWDETNTDPADLVKVAQAFEGVAVAA